MAKLVTVHLVLPYDLPAEIADVVHEILCPAELSGALIDWGYQAQNSPYGAVDIKLNGYEEGEFYAQAALPTPNAPPNPV